MANEAENPGTVLTCVLILREGVVEPVALGHLGRWIGDAASRQEVRYLRAGKPVRRVSKSAGDRLDLALREDRLAHITPPGAACGHDLRKPLRVPPECAAEVSPPARHSAPAAPARRERRE